MFTVDPESRIPIYLQLKEKITGAILSGRLNAGDKLPTVRQLAVDLRINANTVSKVYGELESEGLISTRQGSGSFVSQPRAGDEDRQKKITDLIDTIIPIIKKSGVDPDDILSALHFYIHRDKEDNVDGNQGPG